MGALATSGLSQPSADSQAARDNEMIWKNAGNPSVRHPVDQSEPSM
jgi:hypothetical protein